MLLGAMLAAGCGRADTAPSAKSPATEPAYSEEGISVYFSPQTNCTDLIIKQVRQAKTRVLVQAYSFKSEPILDALADAVRRGVAVRMIIDGDKLERKVGNHLVKRGIDLYIDSQHDKAHSKVMLIDGTTVITGSFNFTETGEEGKADNVLVITGRPKLMEAYEDSFQEHMHHSKRAE
jgi:phosphatidylserine/phosphatidylglycerophosphate/cardiolipin synthase-like enzyme